VQQLRYGFPWYLMNPAPGRFDWRWSDQAIEHLGRLGIEPILDLVHYGCPTWLEAQFVHPDYPARVADWASAVATRYAGAVRYYTPLNEPIVNAYFSGRSGNWPPYLRGLRGYHRVLLALAKGMSLTIAAVRAAAPEAVIVQVEATEQVAATAPGLGTEVERSLATQFLPTELVLGAVGEAHPMRPLLLGNGASEADLTWLEGHGQRIDVMGVNFYPAWSNVRVEAGPDGSARRRHRYAEASDLATVLGRFHERFAVPVMVTETSDIGTVARREAWMGEAVEGVRRALGAGVPVIGFTWFPVLAHMRWDYRGGRRPEAAYLARMGLWDADYDSAGVLIRRPTRLVDRYAALVAAGRP
jgi:beta-glucosidase